MRDQGDQTKKTFEVAIARFPTKKKILCLVIVIGHELELQTDSDKNYLLTQHLQSFLAKSN